jgi:alpha-1,6-mannosyltransferase
MKKPRNGLRTTDSGRYWPATVGLLALAAGLGTIFRYWGGQSDLNSHVPEFIALGLLAGVLYLCGVYLVERFPLELPALLIILCGAVAFRLYLLPLDPPPLSDDVYRYQWDGRVERAHINPYTVTPALGRFEDPAHPIHTARDIPTVYPPLSEFVFSCVSTVSGYKRLFTGLDLATVLVILLTLAVLEKPLHWVLTFAWNPTVIVAFAMCGHHDSLPNFTLVTACFLIITQRRALSSVFLALSSLSKFFPVALLPVFLATVQLGRWEEPGAETIPAGYDGHLERGYAALGDSTKAAALPGRRVKPVVSLWPFVAVFAAVVIAAYLPYARAGRSLFAGLSKYAAIWEANDSIFRLLLLAGNSRDQAKLIVGVALLGLLAYVLRKRMELLRACLFFIAGLLLLSSNAFPWYFTWSIPFLCFYPAAPWLLMSVTSVLGYAPVVAYSAGQPYIHTPFILALEYAPVYLWLCYQGWREVRHGPGPSRTDSES